MYKTFYKRIFDIILASVFLIISVPILFIIFLILKLDSKESFLYWSKRVGKNKIIFYMPKIRTMKSDAPQIATHLMNDPELYLIPKGYFLRKTSLDELPQFWSILKGEMSFVGPRPALFNQYDLIESRQKKGINQLPPGLTGWAQINGRDELSISKKVTLEEFYLKRISFFFDLKIILKSFQIIFKDKDISH